LPNPDPAPLLVSRRTLLKIGVAGGAALLLARGLYTAASAASDTPTAQRLDADARAILAAVTPVMLAGALPAGADGATALREALAGIEQAIGGLPPAARKELEELFSLLAFAPTRCLVAGVWKPWPEATRESVAAFLASWRESRFSLLRAAYGALHQIILGAWYGMPRAWGPIGYPGPPSLGSGNAQ